MRHVCPRVAWRARSTRSGCRLCGPIRRSDQGSGATSTWQTTASSLAPGIGVRGSWWHKRILAPAGHSHGGTEGQDRV